MEIRLLSDHDEYRAVEQLQSAVWNLPAVEIVPLHVLVTAARNGGLLLGAFDGARLVGFVFGFPGLTPDGRLKHCSHMAGVHPDYRDQNLGFRLKLAQRAAILAQGLDLITWTFDPLEARNAWLNFHKLGAVCNTYLRNVYGDMRDGLNAGLPSDRLQVDWWIGREWVEERLCGDDPPSSNSSLRGRRAGSADAEIAREDDPPSSSSSLGGRRAAGADAEIAREDAPPSSSSSLGGRRGGGGEGDSASGSLSLWDCLRPGGGRVGVREGSTLIAIPANFQAIKSADMTLARQWRMQTRQAFEEAFERGQVVVDVERNAESCSFCLVPQALLEFTRPTSTVIQRQ